MANNGNARAGYWIYNPLLLKIYDGLVPGILNRFVWKTSTARTRQLFRSYMGDTHADLGVGTGYYLAKALHDLAGLREANATLLGHGSLMKRMILIDAHPATLEHCQRRLLKLGSLNDSQLDAHVANVTDGGQLRELAATIVESRGKLDSVSANYLFHCLPNGLYSSEPAIEFAKQMLADEGVFFGSMILQAKAEKRFTPRMVARMFRRWKIFGANADSNESLNALLRKHFRFCHIEESGCVATFCATNGNRLDICLPTDRPVE